MPELDTLTCKAYSHTHVTLHPQRCITRLAHPLFSSPTDHSADGPH